MLLKNWKLSCFYPYVPYYSMSIEANIEQKCIFAPIPADVPGSVHKALIKAGLLENPYYEMNSLKAEWIENKWWLYEMVFEINEIENRVLVFEGIDYKAKIFLNGKVCGESENMFVPLRIPVESFLKKGENELRVVLEGAPEEMAQLGISEKTHTQKSRFGYKWDFCTRIVHLGITGNVYIEKSKPVELERFFFNGKASGDFSIKFLCCAREKSAEKLRVKIFDENKNVVFEKTENVSVENGKSFFINGCVNSVRPWYPNGMGEQRLYTLNVSIGESEPFVIERKVGFKDLTVEKNENGDWSSYGYLFNVNGKKVYIKGVNVTPLDMLYGDIKDERYEKLFKILADGNINLIRIWGGGLIESETLYSLADKYGIMIWQEFIQSGAGISSRPSVEPEYLEKLAATAKQATLKANHVSLVAFSGGNELSDENGPIDFSNKNVALLKSIVNAECPWVFMYPTSASGGKEFLSLDTLGKHCDVHGPWKYYGGYHYQLFNASDSMLHSEFGCDGMTNREIFDEYIAPENVKVTNTFENYTWRHHGEWWDTYERDTEIFGVPDTIDEQIAISQFMQAEGLRYAVEANRRRAYQNSGSIIWQANEPFPGISGTNLIDYNMKPKFVWRKVKQAFNKVNPSLRYDKFVYNVGDELNVDMFVTAEGEQRELIYEYIVYSNGDVIGKGNGKTVIGDGYTEFAENIKIKVASCECIIIEMKVTDGKNKYVNDVYFPVKNGKKASIASVINYMNCFGGKL